MYPEYVLSIAECMEQFLTKEDIAEAYQESITCFRRYIHLLKHGNRIWRSSIVKLDSIQRLNIRYRGYCGTSIWLARRTPCCISCCCALLDQTEQSIYDTILLKLVKNKLSLYLQQSKSGSKRKIGSSQTVHQNQTFRGNEVPSYFVE